MFPQIFGKYMLEREIAAGGMARVYLATLRGAGGFEKRLVVKQIRPELASDPGFVERFVKEAKTAVELSHPNIVPVYELGLENGVYYIAMEHCDGATLTDLLSATGPLDALEAAYLGVEVCRALDYAHRRAQIVHRDVTPRNVLIDEEGAVRLIDFGIAAPAADADRRARTEVFGSPGHMPPEQLLGRALTAATDVFAVGVLLYEATTGRPAFRRATAKASREALSERPPAIDSEHADLQPLAPIVARCMDLDESKRPENAEALARPLREFMRSADTGDIARRLGERVLTQRRRARGSNPWMVGEGLTGLEPAATPDGATARPPSASETPGSRTPLTPHTPGGTKTFATSPSFTQLTRRMASEPPLPPTTTGATRRLPPSEPPPPSSASQSPVSTASRSRTSAPAHQGARGRDLYGWWAAALAFLVAGTTVLVSWNQGSDVAKVAAGAASVAPKPALPPPPIVKASIASAAPSAGVVSPSASQAATPPAAVSAKVRAAKRPHAPVSADAPAMASLSLTALPGTSVTVAGQSYVTPVTALDLPAGRYQVTFKNATWDGPVSAPVVLLPGRQSRVHADFTNEPPRVVVR